MASETPEVNGAMQSKWITKSLVALKEAILLALLAPVIDTMLAGIFALAIYNVPDVVWNLQGAKQVVFVFVIVMAPMFALARVMEWWINLYRKFSTLFPEYGGQ